MQIIANRNADPERSWFGVQFPKETTVKHRLLQGKLKLLGPVLFFTSSMSKSKCSEALQHKPTSDSFTREVIVFRSIKL